MFTEHLSQLSLLPQTFERLASSFAERLLEIKDKRLTLICFFLLLLVYRSARWSIRPFSSPFCLIFRT